EMKDILSQNLVKCNKLMVDTDSKLKIALSLNPEDKELKKIIEERNNLFLDFYKEEDNNGNVEGEEKDGDKNGNTNETECDTDLEEVEGNKDECEEDKGNKEQQETDRKSNEDESQNEAEHNESDNIDNIGYLSLSDVQNTTINPPVESTVNATVESADNVVDLLPQICVDAQKDKNLYAKETENIEKQQKEKNVVQPKGIAANVIDAWSDVLNHEEKYRANRSITSHVYYWTEMLPPHLVEDKNQVNERRRIFDENVAIILKKSKKKNFNHVDLVSFFPCMKDSNHHYIICFDMKNAEIDIIDNINNDVEDISVRYGAYAMALVRFIQYYL
ncbi:hypothetical protein Tco_1477308, partial [Tanacetum coccineum]